MTEEPEVSYTTSSGETFAFDHCRALLASDDERAWEHGTDDGQPVLEPRKLDARLAYAGEDAKEECNRLLALAYADLCAGTPGTYKVGEWSLKCYLLKGTPLSSMGPWAGWKVSLYAPDPVWSRETTVSLLPGEGVGVSAEALDYAHDYAHDYGMSQAAGRLLDVPGPIPCDLRIVFYGHADAPYVRVGHNLYQVNVTVPAGGRLVVDPLRKGSMAGDSVRLVGPYGDATDVFSKRERGAEGSGSYIFERVQPGRQTVTWPQSFGVDLTFIERRGGIPWI